MLPSTKRPKEVEEEKARWAEEKVQHENLIKQPCKDEIFIQLMCEWYETLKDKEKKRLTPRRFKRKAVLTCYTIGKNYNDLPMDWIEELERKCNLKLYQKKKKDESDVDEMSAVRLSDRPTRKRRLSGEESSDRSKTSSSESSPEPEPKKTTSPVVIADNDDNTFPPKVESEVPKREFKKFLDLSNAPPPAVWMESYVKGIELPRILTFYSTPDSNILFYDYNPKLKDLSGREVKLTPQPRKDLKVIEQMLMSKRSDGQDKSPKYHYRRGWSEREFK